MNTNKTPILLKNVKTRKGGENILIYLPEDDLFFELNYSSAEVLTLIDGKKSINDIIRELIKKHKEEKAEVIRRDIVDLFKRLAKFKIIFLN